MRPPATTEKARWRTPLGQPGRLRGAQLRRGRRPRHTDGLQDHSEPLGLVIHNDALAIDAVPVLRESRREPGADVALASYDNTYLALREEFSLTSVDQPRTSWASGPWIWCADAPGSRPRRITGRGSHRNRGPQRGPGARARRCRASSLGR